MCTLTLTAAKTRREGFTPTTEYYLALKGVPYHRLFGWTLKTLCQWQNDKPRVIPLP